MPEPLAHGYTEQTLDGKQGDATFWNPSWAWGVGNLISMLDDLKIYARAIGTPAVAPKPRGNSPGWTTGKPRLRRIRYPTVKKTTTKSKKESAKLA